MHVSQHFQYLSILRCDMICPPCLGGGHWVLNKLVAPNPDPYGRSPFVPLPPRRPTLSTSVPWRPTARTHGKGSVLTFKSSEKETRSASGSPKAGGRGFGARFLVDSDLGRSRGCRGIQSGPGVFDSKGPTRIRMKVDVI